MTKVEDARKLPTGWLAMSIGGTIGGAALGALGLFASSAYFDNQPDSDLGDLGWVLLWAALGCLVGAAAGSGLALRMRGYDRTLASGITFALFAVVFLLGWAIFGAQITPGWDEGLMFVLAVGTVVPSAAWLARRVVTSWGRR